MGRIRGGYRRFKNRRLKITNFGSPVAVGAANADGVAVTVPRSDHVHEGLHSIAAFGQPQITGDATLSAGASIALTQVGNDIAIAFTGAGIPASLIPLVDCTFTLGEDVTPLRWNGAYLCGLLHVENRADLNAIVIGDVDEEGGDIIVYRDNLGEQSFTVDADGSDVVTVEYNDYLAILGADPIAEAVTGVPGTYIKFHEPATDTWSIIMHDAGFPFDMWVKKAGDALRNPMYYDYLGDTWYCWYGMDVGHLFVSFDATILTNLTVGGNEQIDGIEQIYGGADAIALEIGHAALEGGDIVVHGDPAGVDGRTLIVDADAVDTGGSALTIFADAPDLSLLPGVVGITVLCYNGPAFSLGDSTHEGGDFLLYEDNVGNLGLTMDADLGIMELGNSVSKKGKINIYGLGIKVKYSAAFTALQIGDGTDQGGDIMVFEDNAGKQALSLVTSTSSLTLGSGITGNLLIRGRNKAVLKSGQTVPLPQGAEEGGDIEINNIVQIAPPAWVSVNTFKVDCDAIDIANGIVVQVLAPLKDDLSTNTAIAMQIYGHDGTALRLGDATNEGGNIIVYQDGAGTITFQVDADLPAVQVPYWSGDYGVAWAALALPAAPNGSIHVVYNSNAGVLATRLYGHSNGTWVSVALA